jgi:hypothetical protein
MIEVRLECKNAKCEKLANHLTKLKVCEYKIWEYNNIVYALIKFSSMLSLNELIRKLKQNRIEFHFSKINCVLPWWKRWIKSTLHR